MSGNKFEKLLEPIQIKQVKIKNRMVKPPQGTRFIEEDGFVNDTYKAHYEALAKGGVGLIIAGANNISFPFGCSTGRSVLISDDKFIPGQRELVEVVHKYHCTTFAQLAHAGPAMAAKYGQPVAASAVPPPHPYLPFAKGLTPTPRPLTIAEIGDVINLYVKAAERASKAGYDGIEVHAAHNYLLNTFLSLAWNKRQDEYGPQSIESRGKIVVQIIKAIKELLGQDYPVGVRFNGGEWGIENGTTAEDAAKLGQLFEKAGADYLHVSGYGTGLYNDIRLPDSILYPEPVNPEGKWVYKPGALVPRAEAVKKAVSIPVIAVGRLDPKLGEWILRTGKADLIAFGRRLLADPELPNKIAEGRPEDIAPCTACLGCIHNVRANLPKRCRINAALGREREYALKPAARKKRVMVVGGGPAGLEAARVAAIRGHDVTLYDKGPKLGGLLNIAIVVKGVEHEDLPALIRYFKTQLTKLGVKIKLGKEVTPALIEWTKPDVIIIASGATPALPEIRGINKSSVMKPQALHRQLKTSFKFFNPTFVRRLTKFWMPIGKRVVIMGGLIQGCELAEFLTKRGKKVTLVETSDQLGTGIADQLRERLLPWFDKKGVVMMTGVKYEEITDKGLIITTKQGEKRTIEADTILPAIPAKPNTELFKAAQGKAPEIYIIGDCNEPRLIRDAVDDGMRTGLAI